ncbi:MAG TPA: tetratricopeptide repeat protein, partial [Thermoanaerobaculia bacterium]|nr:tetratricopeptide repeat protein [Thermoanaerobaculia bacterium]
MAAFLDGTLEPAEVADVAAHLRECADCRTVTGEAARFEEEEEALAAATGAKPQAGTRWRTWGATAVAAIATAAALPFLLRPANPIGNLVDASPREYRRVEGKLSGFRWAPLRGSQRNAAQPRAELELISEANGVLNRTVDDEAAEARHAAGVAHLLIDQTPESLDKLASAAGDSKDARVWNDLAVARYAVAVREGRTALLPDALVAVNRAIELDPKRVDGYFNKALIYEAQGLTDAARKEWQRYLDLDPSSAWAGEARNHLNRLGKPTSSLDFQQELARAAGDRRSLASLVRRFPQESRQKGDGLLVRWADAYLANDDARAEETLASLRAIGEELAATNGERLLLDTVDAIGRTADRRDIAVALEIYGAARKAYSPKLRDLPAAEDGFRRAAAALHAARNPFASVAEYYAAQAAFDRNRPEESSAALTALRARLDPSYHALSAEADWILSRNANAAAYWGDGARFAARAARTFTALGERENAAWMSALEAFALDGMGAYDLASQRRVQSLSNPTRAATILQSAALAFAGTERLDAARAFLDAASDYPGSAELRATILTDRARLAERAGDFVASRRWLGEARTLAAELSPDLREAREANIDLADAVLRRASDPEGAIATLNRSIAFFERAKSGVR